MANSLHVAGGNYYSYRTMIKQVTAGISIGNVTDYSKEGRTTGRHQKIACVHSAMVKLDNVPVGTGDLLSLALLRGAIVVSEAGLMVSEVRE